MQPNEFCCMRDEKLPGSDNGAARFMSLQEEVRSLQERKAEELKMADDTRWRESLKLQMEAEIERRVREALDTPPLERMQRARENARRRAQEEERARLNNSHLRFDFSDRDRAWLRQRRLRLAKNRTESLQAMPAHERQGVLAAIGDVGSPSPAFSRSNNRFDYWLSHGAPHTFRPSDTSECGADDEDDDVYASTSLARGAAGGMKAVRFSDSVETFGHMRIGMDAMKHFGHLSEQEKAFLFLNFTKDGFCAAVRSGNLPDGTPLSELPGQRFRDRYGIVRDRHGPFWPRDYGPLHPTPVHRRLNPPDVEPLFDPLDFSKEPTRTFENQTTPYTGRWRGSQIVFDSDRSPRTYGPPAVSEGMCPSLTFESRFECGNLRQARRTGQFEYELVLQTDLYTKRHTQWFYFRLQNVTPNVTYKFIIVNLLKRSSLYCHGMRPLFYSEKEVKLKGIGWHRHGHHIRYSRNVTRLQCPHLLREMVYYQLEWQCEFQHADDVCYFAHCYPYTYSDLKTDLDLILSDPLRRQVVRKDVLCETRAGNSCFLVTITENANSGDEKERQGVVVTARVHPGETNASWMMKGLLDLLSSPSPEATELRKHFVFKLVPMLNPDGVIVGNYRCSLAARDLNRNYRHPRRETFPTVFHTKAMLEDFAKQYPVVLYCDMHGHSRKPNVFMYGCDSQYRNVENVNGFTPKFSKQHAESFLNERLFPWLMSRKAPEMFSFNGCKFNIRKCKEATGRVVMWRQLNIENSFTMEATFCGTTLAKQPARHFNMQDLTSIGEAFGQALLEFIRVNSNKEKQAEVIIDMTRTVMQQILESRGMSPNVATITPDSTGADAPPSSLTKAIYQMSSKSSSKPAESGTARSLNKELSLDSLIGSVSLSSLDNCFKLLEELKVADSDSDSSDSDSESEPELPPPPPTKAVDKERTKKKKKKLKRKDSELRKAKKKSEEKSEKSTSALPAISSDGEIKRTKRKSEAMTLEPKSTAEVQKKTAPLTTYVSKYEGRSNGGIPCFAEERLLERASKRLLVLQKKNEERRHRNVALYMQTNEEEPPFQSRDELSIKLSELRRQLTSVMRKAAAGEDGNEDLELPEDQLKELYPLLDELANHSSEDEEEEEEEEGGGGLKLDLRAKKPAIEPKSLMPQLQPTKFQNIRGSRLASHRRQSVLPLYSTNASADDGHVIYVSNMKNATGMASAPSALETNTRAPLPSDPLQRRRLRDELPSRDRIANLLPPQRPNFQTLNRR